jgi:hypothetical protein
MSESPEKQKQRTFKYGRHGNPVGDATQQIVEPENTGYQVERCHLNTCKKHFERLNRFGCCLRFLHNPCDDSAGHDGGAISFCCKSCRHMLHGETKARCMCTARICCRDEHNLKRLRGKTFDHPQTFTRELCKPEARQYVVSSSVGFRAEACLPPERGFR